MTDRQGYRVELAPTHEQRQRLGQHAGLSRVVENFCLERVKAALAQREAEKTYGIADKDLTAVPWSAPALERAWRQAHPERFGWFTADDLSSRVPKEACRVRAAGFRNFFGRARVIGATVKETAGRWWVSFQLEIDRSDINEHRLVASDAPACGIDVGVKTFATIVDDDGTVTEIHAPKPLKDALRKLRKANKALARKQRGSSNRAKAVKRVGRVHLEVANRRADFLHMTTTMLARSKRAIAVETLNITGMVANRRLARAISDLGFGEFFRRLAYKSAWYGSGVWEADRWFPSSRLCGGCGAINTGVSARS